MRNKIMMMVLLCALLVGLVPPGSARAEATEFSHYDVETKTIYYNGKSCYVGDACASYIDQGYSIVYMFCGGGLYVYLFPDDDVELSCRLSGKYYLYLSRGGVLLADGQLPAGVRLYGYDIDSETGEITYGWVTSSTSNIFTVSTSGAKDEFGNALPYEVRNDDMEIFYSDLNFYKCIYSGGVVRPTEDLFYASNNGQASIYSFYKWCNDADVNCVPSTRTNLVYEDFVYNSWFDYVVTKNADCYSVYQFYSNDSIEQFTEFVSYDNRLYLHLKDDISGADFFVKRFDYVADGWLCSDVSFCTLKYGELVDLGVVISDDNKLFYSSETIKTGELYGNTYYSKNTEFTQGFAGEVSPDHNPMVTPAPTPDVPSGGGGVGGLNIVTYASEIKAEVKADSVYMRDYPSLDGNAIAAFIKAWDIDVLGYVYDDEGSAWYYCKTVRDDMEYVGFIKAEYLTVLSVENNDIGFGDIDMDDMPQMVETAKNSFLELLGFVGVVPMMIGAVFGFLPSWCLGFVCLTIIVLCVVALIKRG